MKGLSKEELCSGDRVLLTVLPWNRHSGKSVRHLVWTIPLWNTRDVWQYMFVGKASRRLESSNDEKSFAFRCLNPFSWGAGGKSCMLVLERDIYSVVLTFISNFFPQCLGYVPRQTSATAAANPFASSALYSSPREWGATRWICQNCARKCPAICDLWRNHWCVDKCKRLGAGGEKTGFPFLPQLTIFVLAVCPV